MTGHFRTSFIFAGGSVQLPLGLRQSLSYKLFSVSPYMCLLLVDILATRVISAIRPSYATTVLLVSRGQTHLYVKLGLSLLGLRGVALTSCYGIEY